MATLWLLDFDGTLVDSEKSIKACYLKVGEELVPERCNFIKTMVIGPTLDEPSKMILTDKKLHLHDTFKKRFQQLYDDKIVLETPQFPEVDETLKQLRRQGDHLCIVTNKRSYPTHKLIDFYNWHNLFDWVSCMDEYPSIQNKSDLLRLKNINQSQYDKTLFVGDTVNDGISANQNDIKFIRALYGYGDKENWHNINIYKNIKKFSDLFLI